MSREELVRAAYEAWNRGDPDSAAAVLDPNFEFKLPETGMNTGTYRGHDGVRRVLESYLDVFEFFRFELERAVDEDERLVAYVHVVARGRGSGVDVELRPAHVWRFEGERAVGVEVFPNRDDALK